MAITKSTVLDESLVIRPPGATFNCSCSLGESGLTSIAELYLCQGISLVSS